MNIKKTLIASLTGLVLFATPLFAAYTAPTDEELEELLTNPDGLEQILTDATGEEAATLIERIIASVNANENLSGTQREDIISYFTANTANLLPTEQRSSFATQLVTNTDSGEGNGTGNQKALVIASIVTGVGAGDPVISVLRTLAGTDGALIGAITSPQTTLGSSRSNTISNNLRNPTINLPGGGSTGGGGTQTNGAAQPPPVPPTYDGQG